MGGFFIGKAFGVYSMAGKSTEDGYGVFEEGKIGICLDGFIY